MLIGVLAAGGPGFWAVLLLSAVVVSSMVDADRCLSATGVAAGTIILLMLFGGLHPVELVRQHGGTLLLAVPIYLLAGVAWGVAKWTFHVAGQRGKVARATERFRAARTAEIAKLDAACGTNRRKRAAATAELEAMPPQDGCNGGAGIEQGFRSAQLVRLVQELDRSFESILESRAQVDDDADGHAAWLQALANAGIRGSIPPTAAENRARIVAWMTFWPASMTWTLINDPVRRFFAAAYDAIVGLLQGISNRAFRDFHQAWKIREDAP
jgi:hypothetical protein